MSRALVQLIFDALASCDSSSCTNEATSGLKHETTKLAKLIRTWVSTTTGLAAVSSTTTGQGAAFGGCTSSIKSSYVRGLSA